MGCLHALVQLLLELGPGQVLEPLDRLLGWFCTESTYSCVLWPADSACVRTASPID